MKVTSALFAACLVLLCASVSAYSLRRPHWPNKPEAAPEVDRFIPPTAADLFDAIFNPRKSRPNSRPDESNQFGGAQRCIDLHNFVYQNTIYGIGKEIRNSIRVRDSAVRRYLKENDEELVQQQFVANIDQCGASPSSEERINCYTNVIEDVFTDINAPTHRPLVFNKYVIRYRLVGLSWSLYGESIKLERCLSIFPHDPTAAPPNGGVAPPKRPPPPPPKATTLPPPPPPPPKTTTTADDTTTESTDETTVQSTDETTVQSTDETTVQSTDETTVQSTDESTVQSTDENTESSSAVPTETTIAPETPIVETTVSEASSAVTSEPESTTLAPSDSSTAAPEEKSSPLADTAESSGDEETVELVETVETVESVENSENASSD